MDILKQYRTLFHFPLPLTVVGLVSIAASVSPVLHLDRLLITYILIFFGLVLAAYALDAMYADWRFLIKDIPQWQLKLMAIVGITGFVLIATYAIIKTSQIGVIVAIILMFSVISYNLEIPKIMHTKYGFALSWGSASMIGSYYYQSETLSPIMIGLGIIGFLVALNEWHLGNTGSLLQRTITTFDKSQTRKDARKGSFTALSYMCYAWFSVGMLLLYYRIG